MSRTVVNQILGLAAADPAFWRELQDNPLAALQKRGFELTAEEQEVFHNVNTSDLALFCQSLLAQLGFLMN